ncbi:MAG: ABC transporter ATP-binding protein [Deltaproteobacteria bacterium]|nr:ABC transporter ATP-binding protein [Deltaproteobacteria bacterium]
MKFQWFSKVDIRIIRRLIEYVRPYRFRLASAIFLAVVVSITNALTAWLVKPVLDDIFLKKDLLMLTLLPVMILAIYLIKGIATYGQSYLIQYVGYRVVQKIRDDLFAHLNRLSLSFFHRIPSAQLISRSINDVSRLSSVTSSVIADVIRQVFTILGLIFIAFYRDWFLASIAMVVLPMGYFPMIRIGRKIRRLNKSIQEMTAELTRILQETFTGIKIVKAFGSEECEQEKFSKQNKKLFDVRMKGVRAEEVLSPLMEFLGAIGIAAVIWYGGRQVITGMTTPGTFFSFIAATMMLYGPVRRLSRLNNLIMAAMAAAERIFEILEEKPEIVDAPDAKQFRSLQHGIRFRNVSFMYDNSPDMVLREINLEVERGEIVAIVGHSGAGKTTLGDLMPRFFDVSEGSIEIDGVDVRRFQINSLRRKFGIVTQETILFNDTLAFNIAYGKPGATQEEIRAAAEAAYAHEFIMQIPQGYETIIGERGVRLSGGQRQRICIARAILRDPEILILDEATSELDSESEHMVQKALVNLMKNRTTYVIAHRLSTIVNADKIVVLENGRIQDVGKHDELIQRDGPYLRLCKMQFNAAGEW